jgi:CHAD domain-containing protein
MSALGIVYFVDPQKLGRVRSVDDWTTLVAGADTVTYKASGWLLATLLPYLEERGVNLMNGPDTMALCDMLGCSCFALTSSHRGLIDQLDPARYEPKQLRRYYEEFNETSGAGAEEALLEGIRFLREALERLPDDKVGVLVVG